MKNFTIIFIAFVLALSFIAAASAAGFEKGVLKKYDVALIKPEAPLTRANAAGIKTTYNEIYLVRLHGTFPAAHALRMDLFIGDERIEEYGSLPDGIYFIVTEKSKLDSFTGKEFKYRIGDETIHSLGVKFNPADFPLKRAIPEKEAFAR